MRVLFLTHRLPYAPNRGDRIRAHHLVRLLVPHVSLHVVSLVHDAHEEAQVGLLRTLGASVSTFRTARARNLMRGTVGLAGDRPLTHALLDAPGVAGALADLVRREPPDVVLAYCSGMARFAIEPPLAGLPFVVDMVDVDSRKWASLHGSAAAPRRWLYGREARLLAGFERQAARRAHATLVVNERERAALAELAPDATVHVVPNGIDVNAFRPPGGPACEPAVVFCGVMNYAPNVEGISWFAEHVWPSVAARRPDARLFIVGSDPLLSVRKLAHRDRRITVTGTVADVRPYLWDAAVSIAPLSTARGVQNKVLEAVAAGLPAVVTPQVDEGLPAEARAACSVAPDAGTFAERIVDLLARSGHERRTIARSADLEPLAWERQLAPVVRILAEAARGHARAASLQAS